MENINDKYSIENTTKSERIELIKQWEEEEGCDCSGMDLMEFFRDYIDGRKSIAECNAAFSAGYISEIPDDSAIRQGSRPGDVIHQAKQESWIDRQLRLDLI